MEDVFSVIVPTYNRAKLISGTLDSIEQQQYRPIEIIVVDDGSTDDTKTVVAMWAEKNASSELCIIYSRQNNSGPAAARKLGFKQSTGQYVQYLDSDDYLHPTRLAKIAGLFRKEEAELVITGFEIFDDKTEEVVSRQYGYSDKNQLERVLKGQLVVQPLRCAFKRSLLEKVGAWNETMRMGEDRLYIERALCLSDKAVGLRDVLGSLRRGSGDHRSKNYDQRCRVMCEESLAQYAYARNDVSAQAKKAHLSRVMRMALRYKHSKESELAKRCVDIVKKADCQLPLSVQLKLLVYSFGRVGSSIFFWWVRFRRVLSAQF